MVKRADVERQNDNKQKELLSLLEHQLDNLITTFWKGLDSRIACPVPQGLDADDAQSFVERYARHGEFVYSFLRRPAGNGVVLSHPQANNLSYDDDARLWDSGEWRERYDGLFGQR